ncbi:6-phosphofructokinase [Pontiella sulfatireligans]|uniref:ATP-dependent 6-phosphofructokinase n=1 Tax=Pontiella sulfatireligans TaxID=2750658 RepID=A0A6C2UEY0_9BACT|nr:ATP-dependent 6-phosphofructokinase [Pontiella sulfatireligans]VGO18433.1 Pyrophosphate--fructose 6-phosphate 1-phosphotransferase [Pontiella sulfatireligans]
MTTKTRTIGILTSGGDCPGLNAAIRGVAKAALGQGTKVVGIKDGFRGLVENRMRALEDGDVSGILTHGGTFLGSSRDKPHKMEMGGTVMDMTEVAVSNAKKNHIDCLICLGGNGTQKNAMRLHEAGLDVITLPKTIDNDVAGTDITFGFDSSMAIATEAIDRLHTTATSHHRAIVCEIMGHKAGWLALGAGIAGGADVILLPEIPYDMDLVVEHLLARRHHNKRFSIIAVAEGAVSKNVEKDGKKKKKSIPDEEVEGLIEEPVANRIAREIQQAAGLEVRFTSLGHVQRGGSPTATDRLLSTRLGTKAGELLAEGVYNVMVGIKGEHCVAVPLHEVAGQTKIIPRNHAWLKTAMLVDTCLGDRMGEF